MVQQSINNPDDSSALANILKIQKRLTRKWMQIGVFLIMMAFLTWLIWTNIREIINIYNTYKQHVYTKDTAKVVIYTEEDNETYNVFTSTVPVVNNATIQTNIDKLKLLYKPYNDILKKTKDTADVVDEKIISPEYDDYTTTKSRTNNI